MVKLDLITKNTKENDEYYTPKYAIYPLLKYIRKDAVVWCPFDLEESNFVRLLREHGCKVIFSHISLGQDFFNYLPEGKIDYIISNPPYSLKTEVFKKLFELKIPFAMLVGVVGIFESKKRFNIFKENNFEVLTFDKRIKFFKSLGEQNPSLNPPFSSIYVCSNILPKTYCFEELNPKLEVKQEAMQSEARHSSQA